MLRVVLFCLSVAFIAPPLSAQKATLQEDERYQAGLRALKDGLPELALRRFEAALNAFSKDESAVPELHLRLGETSVRAARVATDREAVRQQGEAGLNYLAHPGLAKSDPATFWSAQAFLILGRFNEAAAAFSELDESKDATLRNQARLARVHLLAALRETKEAIVLLSELQTDKDVGIATEARLLQASLLLDREDLKSAEQLLPEGVTPSKPSHASFQRYLRARLALAKNDYEQALLLFTELAENFEHLTLPMYHGSILGRAEALNALERTDEAVEILIQFIDQHPDTPLLDQSFFRLAQWATTAETLRTLFEERLQLWSNTRPPADYHSERPAESPIDLLEVAVGGEEADVIAATAANDPTPRSELSAYALFRYARLMALKNDAESVSLARFLLARLRLEHPAHRLAHASLLETAELHNAEDRQEEALTALSAMEALAVSPELKSEAAKLAGYIQFKKGEYKSAAEAFAKARASLEPSEAQLAERNQAVSLLRAGEDEAFGKLFEGIDDMDAKLALQLERTLVQAARREDDARPALDRFLREHGDHPRVNEARLALAELSVAAVPPDPEMARAQLDIINTGPLPDALALRHLLTRMRLAKLTNNEDDWPDAIADATTFLARESAEGALESGVQLKLAEAYYLNGYYNKARRRFIQLAAQEEKGRIHEVALFYAAKSALKEARAGVSAEQSQQEALRLLNEVIAAKGILATEARLHLADSLIESSPQEALEALAPLLDLKSSDPSQLDALVLAAQAHRAWGGDEHYRKAIELYDRVLAREDLQYPDSNRFHSLRGQAYELLDMPAEALDSYYRVLDRENLPSGEKQTEWFWWEDCGFNLLRLLEARKRWPAALQVARKLATGGGERAEEAAKRAKALQLKHFLWEDE